MSHSEPWQIFAENGESISGKSADRQAFSEDQSLLIGAAHVWIWRRTDNGCEILIQRRAADKLTWPGYLDVSAAVHIDAAETALEAAKREVKEEIGIDIDTQRLKFIFSIRTPLDPREFDTVYTYELKEEVNFTFDDGEVEELRWIDIDAFVIMTRDPASVKLTPQGDAYFMLLISNVRAAISV